MKYSLRLPSSYRTHLWWIAGVFVLAMALHVRPAPVRGADTSDPLVEMDFPDDGIELSLLADIVTRRLHIPILYDDQIHGKKVIIRVPAKVPESSLMGILQSALRLKQFALIDAEQPGWKQIVPAPNLAAVAKPGKSGDSDGPLAQVFILDHADPTKVAELVRPFLSQPGGYVQAAVGQKTLIVGDYPGVVRRVELLIHQLDADAPTVETRFVPLKQAEAGSVAAAVTQLISNRETFQWGSATGSGVFLTGDDQSNQIIVIAPPKRMDEVLGLIAGMDKTSELQTRVYRLKSVSPDRVDQLIRTLLDPSVIKHSYQAGIDRDSQTLVVAATPAVHARINDLVNELDVPTPESANPIQFYKLKNTKASDLLGTISGLLGDAGPAALHGDSSTGIQLAPTAPAPTGSQASAQPNSVSPNLAPPATIGDSTSSNVQQSMTGFGRSAQASATGTNSDLQNISPVIGTPNAAGSGNGPGVLAVHSRGATVAADVNTNSIIVVGPAAVQKIYADLIQRLDQRRPQVQIECTIVTLDTTNNFTFGVDIGKLGGSGKNQLLSLSSFGISSADPVTGILTPISGTGGTFALLNPQIADVVLRALEVNTHARLVSSPELLVNDNGTGTLQSVAQEPYAVILDASSTQSLTSLGGLAQAGTSISVQPHISQADYLQLGYTIELSDFTGVAQNGLPPPSEKNSIDSEVTIPDGYTIVVGGLTTKNYTTAVNTIPVLGDIPILKYLFGTRSKTLQDTTLFVFIRPVILRDDQFEDLKYISARNAEAAGLPSDFPQSAPIALH